MKHDTHTPHKNRNTGASGESLRRMADKRMSEKPEYAGPPLEKEDMQKLIHELQVHQIELEIQNEELVRARNEIETGLERYTELYDFAPVGYFTLDKNSTVRQVNLTGAALFGKERSFVINQILLNFIATKSHPVFIEFLDTIFKGDRGKTGSLEIPLNHNPPKIVQVKGHINASGSDCFLAMIDITAQKQAEETLHDFNKKLQDGITDKTAKLSESEIKYRTMIETTGTGYVMLDEKGRVLDANPEYIRLTGHTEPKEILGKSIFEWTSEPQKEMIAGSVRDCLREGFIRNLEIDYQSHSGVIIPVEMNATRISDKGSIRILALCRDIGDRKASEKIIRASLDEKILLLREVHHRVKNNLQLIISLTSLQMRQVEDQRLRQVMGEIQNRVRAMALVHEKLYNSDNFSTIDLGEYIQFLSSHLFANYRTDTRKVSLQIVAGKIPIDLTRAIPIGLIMNELVSNALKYAFPEGRPGSLIVSARQDDRTLFLEVADTGIGIPADLDWRNTMSLGLHLVILLVEQLTGTIELDRSSGTRFSLEIPEKGPTCADKIPQQIP